MEPGDAQDLAARIDGLEAQLVAMRSRGDERGTLAARGIELEAEIQAVRARLEGRAQPRRSLLDDVRVASPCPASWDEMEGDDRVRHCKACDRQVFYLSAMTRLEAETLLAEHASPCVRLWRRADGTVMTSDCPVGRRRMRVRNVVAVAGSAAVLAALALVQRDSPLPDVRDAESGLDRAQNRAERVAESVRHAAPGARRVRTVREQQRDIERAMEAMNDMELGGPIMLDPPPLPGLTAKRPAPPPPAPGDKK